MGDAEAGLDERIESLDPLGGAGVLESTVHDAVVEGANHLRRIRGERVEGTAPHFYPVAIPLGVEALAIENLDDARVRLVLIGTAFVRLARPDRALPRPATVGDPATTYRVFT